MSKPLPKLSPAQAETWWFRILDWYKKHGKVPFDRHDVDAEPRTLKALVRKGMLNHKPCVLLRTVKDYYTIHADYLPEGSKQ